MPSFEFSSYLIEMDAEFLPDQGQMEEKISAFPDKFLTLALARGQRRNNDLARLLSDFFQDPIRGSFQQTLGIGTGILGADGALMNPSCEGVENLAGIGKLSRGVIKASGGVAVADRMHRLS